MSEIFQSKEKEGMHIITLPAVVDSKNTPQLEEAMQLWRKSQCLIHVLDLRQVSDFMPSAYRPFVQFQKEIKLQDKVLASLNISQKILPNLKINGVESIFNPISDYDAAKRLLQQKIKSLNKSKINVHLINPFIEATMHFMKEGANLIIQPQKPFLKPAGEYNKFQIAGRMNIESDHFRGSVIIGFQREVFEKIYAAIMGHAQSEIQSQAEVDQSAGEILNIVLGRAKAALLQKNKIQFNQSIPEILIGDEYRMHEELSAIVIPFQSSVGAFYLEIGFSL